MFNKISIHVVSVLIFVCAHAVMAAEATAATSSAAITARYREGGLVPVCVSASFHACGLWDRAGRWRVEPRYSAIYENGAYWTVERASGLTGLLDAEGRTLIEPRFKHLGSFHEGLAYAMLPGSRGDDSYGYIDASGSWVIPPQFMVPADFVGSTALVRVPGEAPKRAFEDRKMALVDRAGKRTMLPYADIYGDREPVDGRFVVTREAPPDKLDAARWLGVSDRQGRLIVPWIRAFSLMLVPGGGWVEFDASHAINVRGRDGKLLYRLQGEQAHIREANAEGLAVFTPDDVREGLIDLRSGKVLIAPRPQALGQPSNGRVPFAPAAAEGQPAKWGYLDITGKTILSPQLPYAPGFQGTGVTAGCGSLGERPACHVITHDGRRVEAFDRFEADHIDAHAWESSPQTPAVRDVLTVRKGSTTWLTDRAGRLLLQIEPAAACSQQVVRAGDTIVWPTHPEVSCDISNSMRRPGPGAAAPLRAAHAQHMAFENELARERASVAAQGGGIENMMPGAREARRRWEGLPWDTSGSVALAGAHARLILPPGYRYLSPEARRAAKVAQAASAPAPRASATGPGGTAEAAAKDTPLPGLIAAPDDRWVVEVFTSTRGFIDLRRPLPAADSLLETLKVYQRGDPTKLEAAGVGASVLTAWHLEPDVDAGRGRLLYAIEHGLGGGIEFNLMRFGRTTQVAFMVRWKGYGGGREFELHRNEIQAVVDAVEFEAGHAHTDHRAGDAVAPPELFAQLVTGPPSAGYTRFSQAVQRTIVREEQRKQHNINRLQVMLGIMALVLAVLGAQVIAARRKLARIKAASPE